MQNNSTFDNLKKPKVYQISDEACAVVLETATLSEI
jgi:hypothetical protein